MGVGPSGPTSRSAGGGAAVHRETKAARPVLKWAGGKSQLLETFLHCYPAGLSTGGIRRYMEPFVGSGAVLFDVAARFLLDEYVIVDRNPHLIRTYQVIRDQAPALIERLSAWQELYWSMGSRDREGFYYAIRDRFNAGQDPPLDEAVALIFLNRTCFNGLYRVNRQGRFNVPIGRYDRPLICDAANLLRVQQVFRQVDIRCGTPEDVLDRVDADTFVYCDPPYRPLTATSSFTAYSEDGFGDEEQVALARFVKACDERGAAVMLSNADPHNIDPADNFFDDLYRGFVITRVPARRSINAQRSRRGPVMELVITNYPVTLPGPAPSTAPQSSFEGSRSRTGARV